MENLNTKITTFKFPLHLAESKDFGGKKRMIGMAYLNENQPIFTLKIWMFPKIKYYLLNSDKCASDYLIMTREENFSVHKNSKFHWSIVGRGTNPKGSDFIELKFDLLSETIFMPVNPHSASRCVEECSEYSA